MQVNIRGYSVKRDMDLIRDILILINDDPKYNGTKEFALDTPEELGIKDHSTEEVAYHLGLLIEAGFVDGAVTRILPMQIFRRLTWNGHEFLGSITDPGIWAKTKDRLVGLPAVTLSVVAELAKAELKKHLGLP
jgi:hypothetical protein